MRIKVMCFVIVLLIYLAGNVVFASRFQVLAPYSCNDENKICVSSGTRNIDGIDVYRDCWEYSYVKTCNYPSKDDCKSYAHCYWAGNRECILKDAYGNCVNLQREFSCERLEEALLEKEKVTEDLTSLEERSKLVCEGVLCIDGNCVDKSYLTNGEMMDSISKLHAAKTMKPDANQNFNLFAGNGQHCSKKVAGYENCCVISGGNGWGRQLGAGCTNDEKILMENRRRNLCIYVGKTKSKELGIKDVTKHYFCCFGNMLDKVMQVEARKQLGKNFGRGGSPDCRGLTMDEIQGLDFSKIDFSEFIDELKVKFAKTYKGPKPDDLEARINGSMKDIQKGDFGDASGDNSAAGWKKGYIDKAGGGR
ncbi:MAG: conjugal transfer protein TraN [Rickettsiaceae bacterium]|nr:conjugal transfer protein TraN [Rickettsiaceae bacterium]